jgi:arylsulfatase A-like enzyme
MIAPASRVAIAIAAAALAFGWSRWDDVAIGWEHLWTPALFFLGATLPQPAGPRWRLGAAVAMGVVGAGLSLGTPRPGPTNPLTGADIVLITLDTFRGDRVGPLTPNLVQFAASGRRYLDAEAAAPLTLPSHASLLTGTDPLTHGVRGNGARLSAPTVVDELLEAGFHTGAFVSARVVNRRTGLDRAFEHYDDRFGLWARLGASGPRERAGDQTVARALRWFERQSGARFLWVHLYDAHAPYAAPPPFAPPAATIDELRRHRAPARASRPELQQLAEGVARYDGEIRWVDHLVGRLVDALPPTAVVILVGDHGEGMGENDYAFNHGARLDRAALQVPLVVRWTGVIPPATTEARPTATSSEVARLLRAALHRRTDPTAIPRDTPTGGPLRSFTSGQQHRATELRTPPTAAIRGAEGRLVVTRATAAWYDLDADPDQSHPGSIPADRAIETARLQRELGSENPPAPEDLRALHALGYVE